MQICIFGAGAVGSHFAVRLALAGHDVSCVMRGAHLEAVKANGLTLRVGDADFSARVRASDDPAALGPQDVVISTLKANSLSSLANGLHPLLRDDTAVVFAQNGIPWWYDIGLSADHPPPPGLSFLDPGGVLRAAVSRQRIVGGVIFSSNEIVAPGIVVNDSPERNMLLVGECDDRASEGMQRLRTALDGALIQSPPVPRIREAIWTKLITNMSVSVLCMLTAKTARAAVEDPALQDVVWCMLEEAQSIARSCYSGVTRRSGAAPNHRPSLLQDYERGRPMEIDALVRAPQTFARAAGLSTPTLDALAALAMCRARDKGLYRQV
jgi:2-dehydropantoate 2-reductase